MKKFVAFLSFVLVLCCAASAFADDYGVNFGAYETDFAQQRNLGKDRAGLQWYLVGYGMSATGYYATAREYYTNAGARAEVINALSARYRVPYDRANALYFTEYRFEYTSDGMQYTEVSRVFYDKLGEEICGYRTGHKIFNPVIANTVHSKGAAYAMGLIR